MSVFNGQPVDANTTNAAFLSRLNDSDTVGKVGLKEGSSAIINDAQGYINKIADADGTLSEADATNKTYSSTNYVANGDSRKVAIGKLDTQVKVNADDISTLQTENTNQQTEINDHEGRITDLESNTMTIGGDKTFSGDIVVQGDFEVQGVTTFIDTDNLKVKDANIIINEGGTDVTAEGAGITVDRPLGDGSLIYDSTLASKWKAGAVTAESEIMTTGTIQVVTQSKDFQGNMKVNIIDESTLNAGVTIDSVLIKDGLVDGRDVSVDGSNLSSHIANTSNPHATTAAQVGADPAGTAASAVSAHELALDPHPQYLTSTEGDNAYLKRGAGDYNTFTSKATPVSADIVLIEDSADSFAKKKITLTDLLGGGGTTSPLTTKGDLYTYSTVNTRLPVGTSGQVLSANSLETTGLKWINPLSGPVNFILNSDAEVDTTGWATYADADQASPVDGTGGSPTVTFARTTVTPIAGAGSFLFNKLAGSSSRGQGASYDFTVDPAYRARVINIQFDYIIASGTFAAGTSTTDSDLTVWIYDVTNSTLIQPSSFRLLSNSTSIADKFQSSFQTSATGSQYRLIVHCATTSTAAYSVEFDNIQVTPTEYAFGTPVTDWVAYTPTFTGFGSPTNVNFVSRRVGDTLEVKGTFTNGTPTATEGRITLGYGGANANVTSASSLPTLSMAGKWIDAANGSTTDFRTRSVLIEASKTYFTFGAEYASVTGGALTKQNGNAVSAASTSISIFASVQIQGFSSSVQMSDQTSTRVIAEGMSTSTATSVANGANQTVVLNTILHSTTSGADTTNNRINIIVPGYYSIKGQVGLQSGVSTGRIIARITKNVGLTNLSNAFSAGNTAGNDTALANWEGFLTAGEYVQLRVFNDTGVTALIDNSSDQTFLYVTRISGPNQIAATEQIVARYTKSDASAFNGGGIRVFGNKVADTHGAYNTSTGLFTAPIAGFYHIDAAVQAASASYVAGGNARLYFSVAGSIVWGAEHISEASFTGPKMLTASQTVYLLAGQTLGVVTDSSPTVNFAADATRNSLAIFLIK